MGAIRLVTLLGLLFSGALVAENRVFESSSHQVGLLELFTSEGCSSCPPADRFLTSLVDDPRVFRDFIPIAFHVDYWNYLGWKDRLASAAFSDRQRAYAHAGGISSVYTPGFVYNGLEWRNFFGGDVSQFPEKIFTGKLRAELADNRVSVSYSAADTLVAAPNVHVVLLGFDIRSAIKSGENRGKELRHDFVVLGHKTKSLIREEDDYSVALQLPESSVQARRYALVTWVQAGLSAPLQATGGFLSGSGD